MGKAINGPAGTERYRFEPTVFGAVRRYLAVVVLVALLGAAAGLGYSLMQTKLYRASASVTVPKPFSSKEQDSDEYFDSQVLLLESPEVARLAAHLADTTLGSEILSPRDFSADNKSLEIITPEGANPGSFGASTVKVEFTWPDARVAQVGVNALLRAFDSRRSVEIQTQAEASVAGIEKTMVDVRARDQLADLVNQRTETLVTEQLDLANHPTIAAATEPEAPINGNKKDACALGLLVGAIVGAALAFVRALRHICFDDKLDPAELYRAPLLSEISVAEPGSLRSDGGGTAGLLPTTVRRRSAAEAFRFSARAIEQIHSAHGPRMSVAVVSPLTSASRTAATANIALAMAAGGSRVLAVDAHPAGLLTSLLVPGCPAADGSAHVQPSSWSSSVSVLPFGTVTSESSARPVDATTATDLLAQTKADYDVVLVDTPALLDMAGAAELVRACDAVVVVVDHHEAVGHHLDAVRRLDLLEADIVGYMYNRPPPRSHHHWFGRNEATTRRPVVADVEVGPADHRPVPVPDGAGRAGTSDGRDGADVDGVTSSMNGHRQSSVGSPE